ncbi:hypothetical protein EUGRSUZ_G01239 [Eucalyptus grandis]|uniref:Uncharacterized protein n=2 Tax=Eucalyptus grandis TaxID=71139 RepID=A0ACC3K308_EUCGR|nr:hypothetical protein EUGRSUZ_G01239 [Eucalyptus grandis]
MVLAALLRHVSGGGGGGVRNRATRGSATEGGEIIGRSSPCANRHGYTQGPTPASYRPYRFFDGSVTLSLSLSLSLSAFENGGSVEAKEGFSNGLRRESERARRDMELVFALSPGPSPEASPPP